MIRPQAARRAARRRQQHGGQCAVKWDRNLKPKLAIMRQCTSVTDRRTDGLASWYILHLALKILYVERQDEKSQRFVYAPYGFLLLTCQFFQVFFRSGVFFSCVKYFGPGLGGPRSSGPRFTEPPEPRFLYATEPNDNGLL